MIHCPKCGHTRWKTTLKRNGLRLRVACRKCGEERECTKIIQSSGRKILLSTDPTSATQPMGASS